MRESSSHALYRNAAAAIAATQMAVRCHPPKISSAVGMRKGASRGLELERTAWQNGYGATTRAPPIPALLRHAGEDFGIAVAFEYPTSGGHLVEYGQAGG